MQEDLLYPCAGYPLIQCHLQHGILAFLPLQCEADALFLALECFRATWWGFESLGEGLREQRGELLRIRGGSQEALIAKHALLSVCGQSPVTASFG